MNERGSFDCVRWAEDQTVGGVGIKATLNAIARVAGVEDELWTCYPGHERLARVTEQGTRTIGRHVSALVELGLICHHRRPRTAGRGRTSDRYYLHVYGVCYQCGWGQDGMGPTGQDGVLKPDAPTFNRPSETFNTPSETRSIGQSLAEELPVDLPGELPDSCLIPTFDDFWKTYPRHTAKTQALKAWNKAIRLASSETILAGAERYTTECREHQRDPSFVAHPATWLNAGRWEDEPLPPPRATHRPNPVERGLDNVARALARLDEEEGNEREASPVSGRGDAIDVAATRTDGG